MFCTHCGKEIGDNNTFCPYCGKEIRVKQVMTRGAEPIERPYDVIDTPPAEKKKSPVAAIIISLVALTLIATGAVLVLTHPKEDPAAKNADTAETADTGDSDAADDTGAGGDDGQSEAEVTPYPAEAVEFDGHHYLIVDEAGYWSSARSLCEDSGGHLLTITSQAEQDFIEEYIDSKGTMKHYWLGGTDEDEEGEWEWITGEEWGYTNWCPGQPNNTSYVDTEHGQDYLELQVTRGDQGVEEYMTWTDICDSGIAYNTNTGENFEEAPDYNSTKYYGYICEWDE